MARKHQPRWLEKVYRAIEENPGRRPGAIARLLGEQRSQLVRALPALEEHGYLLSEDAEGGLWPFKERSV